MAAERPRIKILRFVILLAMLSMVRKKKNRVYIIQKIHNALDY